MLGLVLLMPNGTRTAPGPANARTTAAARSAGDSPRIDIASSGADSLRLGSPGIAADTPIPGDSLAIAAAESLAAAAASLPRDYLAEVRANFTAENRSYSGIKVLLACVEPLFIILMMLVLLFSGASARMRDIARNLGHRRYVQVLVYFTLFSVITFLLTLPMSWYRDFALEHQYGLSNENLLGWFTDSLKNAGFSVLFLGVVPLLALAYAAIAKSPRRWWLWLAAGSVPVILITTLLSPLIFEPAFNRFTPLTDQSLKKEILELAARTGIPGRNVVEVNKSEQTKKFNAYVSGFGASQRIVLWDTMLKGMERDEVLFVMGHEMGHYRLNHIWMSVVFTSGLAVAVFFLAGWIMNGALRRFGEAWHIRELHDIASLPLFVITLTLLSIIVQPVNAVFSRSIEHDADIFALEVTRANDAGARAFLKLGAQNRNNPEPSPLVRAMLYDHPPLGERIRFALSYRPWEAGRENRFFKDGP